MVKRSSDILKLVLSIAIVVVLGVILSFKFFKLDLTEEKRHSLTPTTIETLEGLEDRIFFKVYLTGDLPAEYRKLEKAIEEKLDEFRDYSNDLIDYEFVNPYISEDENEYRKFWEKLYDNGIRFTNVSFKEEGVKKELYVFPGALMNFQGVDYPINFLKGGLKSSQNEDMVNSSITNLEYELISKITQHTRERKPNIGILEGHGELANLQLASITSSLKEFYNLERVSLENKIDALSEKLPSMKYRRNLYDAIIVAKPTVPFSSKEQFVLDQYVMNGGKVMWFIDPMVAAMDSLVNGEQAMSVPNNLGLNNMFFDYGFRINNDLIIDLNCVPIPIDVGPIGDKRRQELRPWFYSPRLFIDSVMKPYHPINKNLHNVVADFVSSIDTIENDIDKTLLLTSSSISRRLKSPVRININIAQFGPEYFEDKSTLNPYSPVAVLLEGEFKSAFVNRGIPDTIRNSPDIAFRDKSVPTSMIVVSDGDIIRNDFYPTEEGYQPFPLGFDPLQRAVAFDNSEFIMNSMNHLLNDNAVISLRTRTFKSRLLNVAKVDKYKTLVKFINVAVPILLIVLFGLVMSLIRRRKFKKAVA